MLDSPEQYEKQKIGVGNRHQDLCVHKSVYKNRDCFAKRHGQIVASGQTI